MGVTSSHMNVHEIVFYTWLCSLLIQSKLIFLSVFILFINEGNASFHCCVKAALLEKRILAGK